MADARVRPPPAVPASPPRVMPERMRAFALLLAATAAAVVALGNCLQAFVFPLELELREGTAWLYVLAHRAALSLYDHTRVAFVNMNHGPLDPALKNVVATALPFLSASEIIRFFVAILPVGLFLALWRATGGRMLATLAWTSGLHVFLLGLQPPHFLLGRSDPTALFLLGLMLWVAAGAAATPHAVRRGSFIRSWAAGALGALVIATNWRYFPAVGAIVLAFAIEDQMAAPQPRDWRAPARRILGSVLGLGLPFLVILGVGFDGNVELYYRHFFGFFSGESGWGSVRSSHFQLVPTELLAGRWLVHGAALALIVLGLLFPSEVVPRRLQACVWLPLLALLGVACSVAYFINHSGGGLHYYGVFYVLLAFHLARAIGWDRIPRPGMRDLVVAGVILGLPWLATGRQALALAASFEPAHAFLQAIAQTAHGREKIYSEDYHLFKERYTGEVIDMGDEVFQMTRTNYLGAAFTVTAIRGFDSLRRDPPAFVLTGGLGSPPLQALLANDYKPLLRVPYGTAYAGPAQTLFQRKDPLPSPAQSPANNPR